MGALWGGSLLAAAAAGLRLPDQDAFSLSRGEAFAATADNPSAIYYNPAGITQLKGVNVRLGVYAIDLDPAFQPPGSGQKFHNESAWHVVPQAFCTYTPEDFPLSFGLGFYTPYGLAVKWPQGAGFANLGNEAHLSYETLNPVVAWRIMPSLSIAAGATLNYSTTDLRSALSRFNGDGTAAGYNLGARWEPCSKIALGVSYRSKTHLKYDGWREVYPPLAPARNRADSNTRLVFPQNVIMGISYRPTPKWNIEFNEDYTDWSSISSLEIANFGVTPLNWRPSWFHELGVTRYFDSGWHVSGGFIYNESCVQDSTYTPLKPETDLYLGCAGVGYKGEHFNFDAGYQFGYGPSRTVTGSPAPFGVSADGKYSFIIHGLMVSAGWKF